MLLHEYADKPEAVYEQSGYNTYNFFYKCRPTTQEDCDRVAADILGGPVEPTKVQGEWSYTVYDTSRTPCRNVVQFRPIQFGVIGLDTIRSFYPTLPISNYYEFDNHGIGNMSVYVLDIAEGSAFSLAARTFFTPSKEKLLGAAVVSLATFFGTSWQAARTEEAQEPRPGLLEEYTHEIGQVYHILPENFHTRLEEIAQRLPRLFTSGYPMVIQHNKLEASNILVDEKAGHLTGITGWTDANVEVAPCGVSFWGLECLLGIEHRGRWRYHPNHVGFRVLFWETFWSSVDPASEEDRSLMEVAWTVGLLVHFVWLGNNPVIGAAKRSLLELLCLTWLKHLPSMVDNTRMRMEKSQTNRTPTGRSRPIRVA